MVERPENKKLKQYCMKYYTSAGNLCKSGGETSQALTNNSTVPYDVSSQFLQSFPASVQPMFTITASHKV
jgi:hypothetical protein